MFLLHYNQTGGSRTDEQLPVNVLRRGPLKYFSINYQQNKKFYDFNQEKVVDDFLRAVYNRFISDDEYKFSVMLKYLTSSTVILLSLKTRGFG